MTFMLTVSSGVLDLRGILFQFFGSTHNQGLFSIIEVQFDIERISTCFLVGHPLFDWNFENMTNCLNVRKFTHFYVEWQKFDTLT